MGDKTGKEIDFRSISESKLEEVGKNLDLVSEMDRVGRDDLSFQHG